MRRRLLVAFAVLALLAGGRSAAAAEPGVLVFAAASLKNALDAAATGFTRKTGIQVRTSYAASSAVAKQIEEGAPADLFLSADLDWMNYLDKKGLIDAASRVNLLRNRIVLIAPKASSQGKVAIAPGFDLARLLGNGRLAVGGVRSVPAGKYAKAALQKLGAWPGVEGRLAEALNVRAALALVARGEAPLGIVYATDVVSDPGVKIVGTFPEGSHPPIIYPAALTKAGAGDPAAAKLLDYLKGPAARAAFEHEGFTVVTDRSAS